MPTSNRNSDPQPPLHRTQTASSEAAVTADASKAGSTAMAVFSADLQGDFTGCNAVFTQVFGYSPQELLGRNFSALFAPTEKAERDDQTRLRHTILTAASTQGDFHSQLVAYPKSGIGFPVHF